jgi:ribosome biogenesis GTPase
MRELQLWGGGEALGDVFSEVDEIAPGCRFRDCTHTSEPGCAVLAAVRDGTLPEDRLQSYHKLRGELRYLESLQDESARAERKRKEKELTRAAYRLSYAHGAPDRRLIAFDQLRCRARPQRGSDE